MATSCFHPGLHHRFDLPGHSDNPEKEDLGEAVLRKKIWTCGLGSWKDLMGNPQETSGLKVRILQDLPFALLNPLDGDPGLRRGACKTDNLPSVSRLSEQQDPNGTLDLPLGSWTPVRA